MLSGWISFIESVEIAIDENVYIENLDNFLVPSIDNPIEGNKVIFSGWIRFKW